MRNNVLQRFEAQDTGSIILAVFEPEIVLSSVRTVIEEYKNSLPAEGRIKVGRQQRQEAG
jgi:hypothetical protein